MNQQLNNLTKSIIHIEKSGPQMKPWNNLNVNEIRYRYKMIDPEDIHAGIERLTMEKPHNKPYWRNARVNGNYKILSPREFSKEPRIFRRGHTFVNMDDGSVILGNYKQVEDRLKRIPAKNLGLVRNVLNLVRRIK